MKAMTTRATGFDIWLLPVTNEGKDVLYIVIIYLKFVFVLLSFSIESKIQNLERNVDTQFIGK
jgi:hypothetical protein